MFDSDKLYEDLKTYIAELDKEFIADFIPADPAISYDKYKHKVKAYCVLCHAALEEFFETIALSVMDESINRWILEKRTTDSLITLVSFCGAKLDVEEHNRISFDHVRALLTETKVAFSRKVYENHGVAMDYVASLMTPVALDVSADPILRNSLEQLANKRGAFAHKGRVKVVLSPEDAQKYVDDCLTMCKDIKEKVKLKFA